MPATDNAHDYLDTQRIAVDRFWQVARKGQLLAIGEILRANVRQQDLVARWGGDRR